ncbi:MAG: prolipoprotein diacylglyceryl transferase [Bacteroidales bacterium]|nr:prolipoprotein diacylglyceryl transferase [Bacteroidales bacterium]
MFLYIIWHPDPTFITIFDLEIRWYGVLFALGFLFGYFILKKIVKKENINVNILDRLSIYMLLGTIIGARLGHCLFYEPGYYLENPWQILNIRQGGLASHGGAIGILVALWLFSRKEKKPFYWILDRIVIPVALGGSLIRLGNLMNSEIYGKPTNVPWAFVFELSDAQKLPRHPTQIYESVFYLLLFFFLYYLYFRKNAQNKPYYIFSIFLIGCFGFRFFIEFLKDIQVDFENYMIINMGQLLSIPFVLAGIYLFYRSRKIKGFQT